MTRISCSQHDCTVCQRTTAQCGGMLFRYVYGQSTARCLGLSAYLYRCQTCPQAFCEDCLPESDIDAVGDVLPELLVNSLSSRLPSVVG
jgi:SWI/SNF-related matrix-associated actin-dependent regulator of chromatin subfamily A member 5